MSQAEEATASAGAGSASLGTSSSSSSSAFPGAGENPTQSPKVTPSLTRTTSTNSKIGGSMDLPAPPPRPSKKEDVLGLDMTLDNALQKESFLQDYLKSIALKPSLLIFTGVSVSHFFGYWGLSYFWSLLVMLLLFSSLRVIMSRLVKKRMQQLSAEMLDKRKFEYESAEWLNIGLRSAYLAYKPFFEKIILDKVNPILKRNKMEIVSIDFGKEVPRINKVKSRQGDVRDQLEVDLELDFFSKFKLEFVIHKGIDIGVKVSDLTIYGAQIRFRGMMCPDKPFFPWMSISLLDKPDVDVKIKTSRSRMDLTEIPGISSILHESINEALANLMLEPKCIEVDILKIITQGQESGAALRQKLFEEADASLRKRPDTRKFPCEEARPSAADEKKDNSGVVKVQRAFQEFGDSFKKIATIFDSSDGEEENEEATRLRMEKKRIKREKAEEKKREKVRQREASTVIPAEATSPSHLSTLPASSTFISDRGTSLGKDIKDTLTFSTSGATKTKDRMKRMFGISSEKAE